MTTKAKCYALAEEHDIKISAHKGYYGWECDLHISEGYTLEDYPGARTGLSFSGIETAKEFWQAVYEDIKTCIAYKPWYKTPDEA